MVHKHVWKFGSGYFVKNDTEDGLIGIMPGFDYVKGVFVGDIVSFDMFHGIDYTVERVDTYHNAMQMLDLDRSQAIAEIKAKPRELAILMETFPPEVEELDIYVFQLRYIRGDGRPALKFSKASTLLQSRCFKDFSRVISKLCGILYLIMSDYPGFVAEYYCKYVPALFTGSCEIMTCEANGTFVAVAVLYRSEKEARIDAFYVDPGYRNMGIGTELIERCFGWLETDAPIISIPDNKMIFFKTFIRRYGWEETAELTYDGPMCEVREHFFNNWS